LELFPAVAADAVAGIDESPAPRGRPCEGDSGGGFGPCCLSGKVVPDVAPGCWADAGFDDDADAAIAAADAEVVGWSPA